MRIILVLVLFTFIQCNKHIDVRRINDEMKKNIKKPKPKHEFQKLLSIADFSAFQELISDEQNIDKVLRIPMTAIYQGSKTFGPDQVIIGNIQEEKEVIEVKLNDTRMGIGIQSHLRSDYKENICEFWADVIWQGMDGVLSKLDDNGRYTVMAVGYVDDTDKLDREFVYERK